MNKILEVYEKQLKIEQDGLQGVLDELIPLEKKKAEFEESIKALIQLVEMERKRNEPIIKANTVSVLAALTTKLIGKTAIVAYKELASIDFKDQSFNEKDIRELANKEGLRVNGEFISGSYSRGALTRLTEKGFLEKAGRGLYRYKEQKTE